MTSSAEKKERGLGVGFYLALWSGLVAIAAAAYRYLWLADFSLSDGTTAKAYAESCELAPASFLIFSQNVYEPLIYYSHLLALLSSAFFALLLAVKAKDSLNARKLVVVVSIIALWSFSNLVVWATPDIGLEYFFWATTIILEVLLYGYALSFILGIRSLDYEKIDAPSMGAGNFFLTAAGLMALAAPFFALGELDASNCDRVIEELPFVTNFVTGLIFVLLVTAVWLTVTSWRDKKILLMSGATTLMLAIFSASNIVGVFSQEYGVENYNLFGVPIFVAFLAYSTIYFKNLNANLIGTQTLIFSLLAFVIAGLFLPDSASIGLALGFKVVTVVFVGGLLMMSSRRETRLRERAEALSKNLEVANLRLLELDKQKTEFVSLASHQLRGPITAIKGYASMLNEGDYGALPVAAMEILGRVQKSAHDMAVLIGDYLDVTRIELGKVKFQPERFSMRDLLSEVEKELLPNTPKERVTLEIEEGADPRFVYADRNKVKQVVGNLIDNAVKYTPKGAVKVTLTRNGGYARMEVKDNGVGINKTSLPHLFQKFSRAQNASKSNIKGTGLGLYIAKTIADHHRGRLSAMSEGEGKGSTFIFELPLADEQAPSKKAA